MFLGNLTFGNDSGAEDARGPTAATSGSFLDEGFRAGQLVRIGGVGAH
jgi:hypothetical protein